MTESRAWIEKLGLLPHPEGGFYREVYRAAGSIPGNSLPKRFGQKPRPFGTSIYFMLTGDGVSRFHRINQDEIWNHHHGSGLHIHVIEPGGGYTRHGLGTGPDESPQFTVPAGCYFGAEVRGKGSFSLAGCTCCPGFSFTDLYMPSRGEMLELFPHLSEVIEHLTPDPDRST
ncbi:MAG: cupin domain-containing protein [Candidatus Fermentibacteraceae bacterium]